MAKLDVAEIDHVHCVVARDGAPVPILLAGSPVRNFLPGWRPRGACDSFAPWTVLDLVHESGREASWLLGKQMEYWSTPLAQLDAPAQAGLIATAAPAIQAVHAAMLVAVGPAASPAMAVFDGLNREDVTTLVGLAGEAALGTLRVVAGREGDQEITIPATGPKAGAKSRPLRLRAWGRTLEGDWQAAIQSALASGFLTCASPVDGKPVRSADSLVLHEHRIAYRFVDARHQLVFFVSTTHRLFEAADLYIPAIHTVFSLHGDDPPPADLACQFVAHCITDAGVLLTYLGTAAHRPAVTCRGYPGLHMGHQLWNELTALDRLVRDTEPGTLPTVIIPNAAQGSEVFGAIDDIFPEFTGRVDRDLRSPQTLGNHVYAGGYLLLRALDERVTQALALRIRRIVERSQQLAGDVALIAQMRAEKTACVLFGLRVENRTAIDPGHVIAESIEHLRHTLGRRRGLPGPASLVVVIDGHNSRLHDDPVCLYESFGQSPQQAPILTELQLVMQLRRRFENTGVAIVNLCGASVARSLFWGFSADFFMGFWGAGLAKYRWVCNRPGLVLSNRWNLEHRGDLDIYHAPRYQEAGSAMRFIDPGLITDLPEATVQFAPVHPVPHYSNFQIDIAGLRLALDGMIQQHLP